MGALIFLGSVALFYFLVMIPPRYLYISEMNKKETGLSQNELYEKMSFEEEQLHFHVQGNPFNMPAALVAYAILSEIMLFI